MESEQSVLATLDFLSATGKANVDAGDRDSGSDDDDTDAALDETRRAKKRPTAAANARNLDSAEEEALNEFQFLGGDKADSARRQQRDASGSGYGSGGEDSGGENWSAVDYQALNRKKEQYQKEAMTKKGSSSHRKYNFNNLLFLACDGTVF